MSKHAKAAPKADGELACLRATRRTGDEPFTDNGQPLSFTLRDFWCWSTSDLLNNTTRGVIAEFLVASALGIPTAGVREPWAAYDLVTVDGLKIEVKSSAYLQSWAQQKQSTISFSVRETCGWNAEMGKMDSNSVRQAEVYVFALLAHRDKTSVNPLDVSQWQFFALPAKALNERHPKQKSISLKRVEALCGQPLRYHELGERLRSSLVVS